MKAILILLSFIFCLCITHSSSIAQPEEKETLLNGWYLWDPYQYIKADRTVGDVLTGLDVELTRAIAQAAGKKIVYEPVSWKQHQLDLKEGKRDIAAGATYTDERAEYVYFSKPYRYEENSLFVLRGLEEKLQFKSIDEFLKQVKNNNFRLGVIDGFVYADPKINEWLKKPENQHLIHRVSDDLKNIDLLLTDKIDGFLADRIVGATLIWRTGHGSEINEVRLGIKTPIHFMFSKESVPYPLVEKFNQAIDEVHETDQYSKLISWYLHPVLLLQTIESPWFRLIEILGTIAFAISGLVIAYRDRSTLFGAFIFAVLPSLGGGIVRDVVFDREPIGAMQSPLYLSIVILTVLIGFFGVQIFQYLNNKYAFNNKTSKERSKSAQTILMICDAMGLAAFTVSGIVVSVLAKVDPLWLWGPFFAFLTGAGGGILRDSLSKDRDFVSLRGDIYPEIAVIWGFLLSILLIHQSNTVDPDPIRIAVFVTVIGAFITRLIIYYLKIPNILFYGGIKKPLE